jgi:general stress protein 26
MESKMETKEKLMEMVGDFGTAMLVTQTTTGAIDARPMAVAQSDDDGELWFVTSKDSGKMAELNANPQVGVTMQSRSKFVSLVGDAHEHDNRAKIKELWSEALRVWFPGGQDDPSITLIHFKPKAGEYWDNSGFTGLKYLFNAGRAYLEGERLDTDESTNAEVPLN